MKTIRIEAAGVDWLVREQTGAVSPPVLLLHGFAQSSGSWAGIAGRLERFHLLIPDLPGHGETAPPIPPESWRLERLADALDELCDRLRSSKCDLVGYSMGGRAALHLAVRHASRIARLVLVSATPGIAPLEERRQRAEADDREARAIEEAGIETFVDRWETNPIFASQRELPPSVRDEIRRGRLANRPDALAAALRAFGPGFQNDLWGQLSRLAIPTLIVVGQRDTKYRMIAEKMASLLPDAKIDSVEGTGHAPFLEAPDRFAEILESYLSRPLSPARPAGAEKEGG